MCGRTFNQLANLNAHMRTHVSDRFTCIGCGSDFTHDSELRRHVLQDCSVMVAAVTAAVVSTEEPTQQDVVPDTTLDSITETVGSVFTDTVTVDDDLLTQWTV